MTHRVFLVAAVGLVAAIGLVAVASSVQAVEDLVELDTAWTAEDGPLVIEQDSRIPSGVSLTLEPGALVTLAQGCSLFVEGALVARGTTEDPVVFTGVSNGEGPARWGSIRFEDSSADATFDSTGQYQAGSILEHCTIEYGSRAVQLHGASPFISASRFSNNRFESDDETEGGAALWIAESSAPWVRGCTFSDNTVGGYAQGGAVYVQNAQPLLQDNLFEGNEAPYGGALSTAGMVSPIVGNRFVGNNSLWEGGAVALVSSMPAFLNNEVKDNSATADGAGVHVCTTCNPHANPLFLDNTITGNASALLGAGGVGAAFVRVFAFNNVHGNTSRGDPYDFGWFNRWPDSYPSWATHPDLGNNYWGTEDLGEVEEQVFDGNDDELYTTVSLEPILTEPVGSPETRVTITTRRVRFALSGEPMPVYLTVYNPGPPRTVELFVYLEYEGGLLTRYGGPLDIEGTTFEGDRFLMTLAENAVHFTELTAPSYRQASGFDAGFWHAALFDPETGERIGQVCTIGFELGSRPEENTEEVEP